jgi:hypothetical protein
MHFLQIAAMDFRFRFADATENLQGQRFGVFADRLGTFDHRFDMMQVSMGLLFGMLNADVFGAESAFLHIVDVQLQFGHIERC